MISAIIVISWLGMAFWAMYMWYLAYGGFDVKFGLSPEVVVMALFAAPVCFVAWTVGYLYDKVFL